MHDYTAFEENNESRYWKSSGKIAKYVADRIEQQHRFFTSLLYSLALAILFSKVIDAMFRHEAYDIMMYELAMLTAILLLFLFLSNVLYHIVLGGYCANTTLVMSIAEGKNWKESLKSSVLSFSAEKYKLKAFKEIYFKNHGVKREYIVFFYDYKGVIRLTIKTLSFKLNDRIILTMSITTRLFGVLSSLFVEWWKSIGKLLKRKEEVIGVDPWYEVMEDFTLFFDDLFKAFEKFGIKLKETIP
ncbi:MAG: hypothetical protein LM601_10605 [Candidatus Verstraetearchaeota archaeon]|nr:hypothetical protein [Candidatus Verstraetearchaeota archaeon]